nr:GTP-binding protein obg [Candidatus Pantoea persica]
MAIWKRDIDLDALNAMGDNSLVAHIGIRFTAIGDDYLEAVMPVDTPPLILSACCTAARR